LAVIPRADIDVRWDINYASLRAASPLEIENGFGTRQYSAELVVYASWEEAIDRLAEERESVVRIAAASPDADTFDELAREEEGEPVFDEILGDLVSGPDVGMESACLALCAAGCVTAASCRGHPGEHAWAPFPTIFLAVDNDRALVLDGIARIAGCGLANASDGKLELWAPSLEEMMQFTELVIAHRDVFERIPLTGALQRARGATGRGSQTPPFGL
jgi:hypothetical protein